MAMRRQTWLLLVILVGVGVFALLSTLGSHARAERSGVLDYLAPSRDELAAALDSIRTPHGFHRSNECFSNSEPEGPCFIRIPSLPPTPSLLKRLTEEAGFSLTVKPAEYEKPVVCLGGHRPGLGMADCSRVAMLDGLLFSVAATAAVVVRDGVAHGTSATLRSRNDHVHLRGIELSFSDPGIPSPEPPS
jgi:hypothetical protein